jgi:hypothetical protein
MVTHNNYQTQQVKRMKNNLPPNCRIVCEPTKRRLNKPLVHVSFIIAVFCLLVGRTVFKSVYAAPSTMADRSIVACK